MINVQSPVQSLAFIGLKANFIYPELERLQTQLNLPPDVIETANNFHLISIETGFGIRRNINIVTAAALYAACRGHNIPITLDEMAKVSGINRQKIGRTYKLLSKALNLKITPALPIEYVQRLCSRLNLDKSTQLKAGEILKRASDQELTSGKTPTGIAAAAVYIASVLCDNRKTQREVAIAAGISEVTIRNNFKELNEKLRIGLTV